MAVYWPEASASARSAKQVRGVTGQFPVNVPRAEPRVYTGRNPAKAGCQASTGIWKLTPCTRSVQDPLEQKRRGTRDERRRGPSTRVTPFPCAHRFVSFVSFASFVVNRRKQPRRQR